MSIKIYHNPRCSKSRLTLGLLEEQGVAFETVEYLKTPPNEGELKKILKALDLKPRELMRKKEAKEAGLDDEGLSDAELIKGMVAHPIVIERPIVVNGSQACIGRPPESVLEIL